MKKILLFLFILIANYQLSAQSGAVYYFNFTVDQELTDNIKVNIKNREWFTGWSEGKTMPDELIDSIIKKTEKNLSSQLSLPVNTCFRKNKKGKRLSSVGVFGQLEGLPDNTFKTAIKSCPSSTLFISINVQIYASGGSSVVLADRKKTKLKPKFQLTAKVFDARKNKIAREYVVIKDLKKLRSMTQYYGNLEVTNSETLTPYDLYAIYLLGLEKLTLKL